MPLFKGVDSSLGGKKHGGTSKVVVDKSEVSREKTSYQGVMLTPQIKVVVRTQFSGGELRDRRAV